MMTAATDHVHRFLPAPAGRLYGKVLWRNTCRSCGIREHPDVEETPPRPIRTGRPCLVCKTPTAFGTVDPADPIHPCCAEPELMRLSRDAVRRHRRAS